MELIFVTFQVNKSTDLTNQLTDPRNICSGYY